MSYSVRTVDTISIEGPARAWFGKMSAWEGEVVVDRPGADRSVMQVLSAARQLVDPAYRAAVERLPDPARRVVAYHAGWQDVRGSPGVPEGKALRPALVVAAALAAGADRPGDAVPEAVAVEAVHDFSLLHDDVMDDDRLRRGRAAAWTVFGVSAAVLAGDSLLALAINELVGRPSMAVLAGALSELCRGQNADLKFESRDEVDLDECVVMVANKTAALLSCACAMGAVAAGAGHNRRRSLTAFGHHLGMAYQFVDDLQGIWGRSHDLGKPVGSDLAHRKKNPLIVAALTADSAAGQRLRALYRDDQNDEATLAEMAELIEQTGARTWAGEIAARHRVTALDCLAGLPPQRTRDLVLLTGLATVPLPNDGQPD